MQFSWHTKRHIPWHKMYLEPHPRFYFSAEWLESSEVLQFKELGQDRHDVGDMSDPEGLSRAGRGRAP